MQRSGERNNPQDENPYFAESLCAHSYLTFNSYCRTKSAAMFSTAPISKENCEPDCGDSDDGDDGDDNGSGQDNDTPSGSGSSGSGGSTSGSSGSSGSGSSGSTSGTSSGSSSYGTGSHSGHSPSSSSTGKKSDSVSKASSVDTSSTDRATTPTTGTNSYGVSAEKAKSVCDGITTGRTNTNRLITALKGPALLSDDMATAKERAEAVIRLYNSMSSYLQCSSSSIPIPSNAALKGTCSDLSKASTSLDELWPEGYFEDLRVKAETGITNMEADLKCSKVRSGS